MISGEMNPMQVSNIREMAYFYSMTLIVTPKNKQEEKVLKAFLNSLSIGFYSEDDENTALHNAMQKGRKTDLLTKKEQDVFLKRLKQAR